MVRRIVSYHLIVLLLLPGVCAAHAHVGADDHDVSGLYRPPHFHLRDVYAWLDSEPVDSSIPNPADHDRDAVYIPDSVESGWHAGRVLVALEPPAVAPFTAITDLVCTPAHTFPVEPHRLDPALGWSPLSLVSVSMLI
jgi:hypothetical protein